ncbi:RNA recognition motif domain-containing protein [Planctomicrobium sp. SH661]|uniref:RNA recognition motif domain-containing protein n=1 Tax=Planctomicrobium sp. SH661 TaxID=3448124 RepID=UPI003F5AEBDB
MTSIYVGNLSFKATEADVRSAFERFGRVSGVQMMMDQVTGRSKGFAFVRMGSLDDADEAMTRLNGTQLQGRKLIVNEAKGRSELRSASAPSALARARWDLM